MINENVEMQIGMTIHIIMFFSVKRSFFVKDCIYEWYDNTGNKSEPSINNIFTTDGIKIESKIDKIATMISPFFIKKTGFFL